MTDVMVTALEKNAMRKKSMGYKKGSKGVDRNTVALYPVILSIITFTEKC